MINGWSIVVFTWNWVSKENNNDLLKTRQDIEDICVKRMQLPGCTNSKHMSLYWKCGLLTQNIIFWICSKRTIQKIWLHHEPWSTWQMFCCVKCDFQGRTSMHWLQREKQDLWKPGDAYMWYTCLIPWMVVFGGANPKEQDDIQFLIKMHVSHLLKAWLRKLPQQDIYRFLLHNKKHCESSTAPPPTVGF